MRYKVVDNDTKQILYNKDKCVQCGTCYKACVSKCININEYKIDKKSCVFCTHCVAVCPNNALKVPDFINTDIEKHSIDFKEINKLIRYRRSQRTFLDKEIPVEVINKLLDLYRYAPTGSNTQSVQITHISGNNKLKVLENFVLSFYKKLLKAFNKFTKPLFTLFLGSNITRKMVKMKRDFNKFDLKERSIIHPIFFCFTHRYQFHPHPKQTAFLLLGIYL